MSKIQVQHVKQPNDKSCVHTCLSMVTGIPVDDLVERLGERALGREEEATILCEMGILPVSIPGFVDMLFPEVGAYLVTVPSMNDQGKGHRLVIEVTSDWDYQVFDPQWGRAGKNAHGRTALMDGRMPSYSDITRLVPLAEHKGTARRVELYASRTSDTGDGK